jgi:hypothetical protein
MARLPPSRHPLHCGLRIPDLRARDDSPHSTLCHQAIPAICLTPRLPVQKIRRCDLNASFRIRSQQCDGDWWSLLPRCYCVAHAARVGTDTEICDTVRLRLDGLSAGLFDFGAEHPADRHEGRRLSARQCDPAGETERPLVCGRTRPSWCLMSHSSRPTLRWRQGCAPSSSHLARRSRHHAVCCAGARTRSGVSSMGPPASVLGAALNVQLPSIPGPFIKPYVIPTNSM